MLLISFHKQFGINTLRLSHIPTPYLLPVFSKFDVRLCLRSLKLFVTLILVTDNVITKNIMSQTIYDTNNDLVFVYNIVTELIVIIVI